MHGIEGYVNLQLTMMRSRYSSINATRLLTTDRYSFGKNCRNVIVASDEHSRRKCEQESNYNKSEPIYIQLSCIPESLSNCWNDLSFVLFL